MRPDLRGQACHSTDFDRSWQTCFYIRLSGLDLEACTKKDDQTGLTNFGAQWSERALSRNGPRGRPGLPGKRRTQKLFIETLVTGRPSTTLANAIGVVVPEVGL